MEKKELRIKKEREYRIEVEERPDVDWPHVGYCRRMSRLLHLRGFSGPLLGQGYHDVRSYQARSFLTSPSRNDCSVEVSPHKPWLVWLRAEFGTYTFDPEERLESLTERLAKMDEDLESMAKAMRTVFRKEAEPSRVYTFVQEITAKS